MTCNRSREQTAIALFFIAIFCLLIFVSLYTQDESPAATADTVCYDLHSIFLDQEGWHRATLADRAEMERLAAKGALQYREEKSLQCHDGRDPATEWLASQVWYRGDAS